MDEPSRKPFRVIVAGGGVAGLLMSHALHRAKIDHVVLESHANVVATGGASFGFWPHAARIIDQFGLWEKVQDLSIPMKTSHNKGPGGYTLSKTRLFEEVTIRHGYDFLVIERQQFVKILYDNLPDKSKVLEKKAVKDIINLPEGVRVILDDGSEEEGDIVVGCDGVNSTVRQLMWESAKKTIPDVVSEAEKNSLTTEYSCLLGVAPPIPGLQKANMTITQHHGFSFMVTTQRDQTFFFVFIKLPKAVHWPEKIRYTAREAEEEAAKYAELPVTDDVRFGQLWKQRIRGHLYCLEEGIFKLWHYERFVLVGDAAHKMTPTMALGGSCTIESVAVLANELNRELNRNPSARPSQAAITNLFTRYQAKREQRAKVIYNVTHEATRVQARDGLYRTMHAIFVAPFVSSQTIADRFAMLVRGAAKFDFLPVPTRPRGTVGFDDEQTRQEIVPVSIKNDQHRSAISVLTRLRMYLFHRPLIYLWGLFKH